MLKALLHPKKAPFSKAKDIRIQRMLTNDRYAQISLLCLGMAPTFFLTIPHWVHYWYLLLLLTGLAYALQHRPEVTGNDTLPLLILAAPFIATLSAQIFRDEVLLRSLDSPSRLLCAIPIYFLLRDILKTRMLEAASLFNTLIWSSVVALITLPYFIDDARTLFYGGRIATDRVDTNTLGSYIGILLTFVLIGIWRTLSDYLRRDRRPITLLALSLLTLGSLVGMFLLMQTQSRGAWIGFLGASVTLSILAWRLQQSGRLVIGMMAVAAALFLLLVMNEPAYQSRLLSIPQSLSAWIETGNQETSGGIRMSMLTATFHLFLDQPLAGYGEKGYISALSAQSFEAAYDPLTLAALKGAGPHNGILDQMLENGALGLGSSLLLYLAPVLLLLTGLRKNYREKTSNNADLQLCGVVFLLQTLLLQFTINPYGLRMLATFNALMLALFLASKQSNQQVGAGQ
jgi:O-antigen ligase